MLEFNKYFTKEIKKIKNFITVVYAIVDGICQESTPAHIKNRKNIKYSISQLTEQLNLNNVKTKSLLGLIITRLRTKILSHNICYFINKCLGKNVDIGKIKELIFD
ncbi:hypothetical protein [Sporanaerobacter acetigenes]|uniref:Uncharacterized protein n=1 Tax=Sporanaerobacter acetigenes DSM 13106 TaxID=1123281 RepID=A0A1M5Z8Z3_9FIRM|nr:hypothetical protein [Sporanaerobacter acetigenes]SHI20691.1 hypothetical protein SAMN02745180_02870 [Sporanaerobacter acetigenes DSM 13106]